MRLADRLECVMILEEGVDPSRERAIEAILGTMAARGLFDPSLVPGLRSAISRRDEMGPTGIGEGVAIPHAWHPGLDRIIVGLAISQEGLDYDSLDGQPVQIVLLILTPPDAAAESAKLGIFASWLGRLRDPAFRAELRLAGTPEALWEVIRREDAAAG